MNQSEPDNPAKTDVLECEGKSVAERQEREQRETLHYQRADDDWSRRKFYYFLTLLLLAQVLLGLVLGIVVRIFLRIR